MSPSQAQWLTLGFLLLITALVLGYDLAVIRYSGADASISRVIGHILRRNPTLLLAVVFWLGVLIGHLWLPSE
jgi:hypothetical protein